MKPKQLIKELCKLEGKKKQVNIAQMTEVVSHLSDIMYLLPRGEWINLIRYLELLGESRFEKHRHSK